MTTRLLIDCDPGFDDAIAILLAAGHPDVEIVALTTVAGNQTLPKVTANAGLIAGVAQLSAPIAAGADRPLLRDQITAGDIHGESGLDGAAATDPVPPVDEYAVDLIIRTVLDNPGQITLVPIGPLTNIAMAVRREPAIVDKVAAITIMGGSYTRGNTTATSEFNILADPEAAAIVFDAGWKVTMVGLDLTAQAQVTPQVRERIGHLDTRGARLAGDLIDSFNARMRTQGRDILPTMHDACAVAYAIDPSLMTGADACVDVETRGQWSYGQTVTDFKCRDQGGGPRTPNAFVPTTLDTERFWDLLIEALGSGTGSASAQ